MCVEGKTTYELRLEREELDGLSVLDALFEPTRIYVKPVRSVLHAFPGAVHALAHITGGGISENLNRALNDQVDAEVHVGTWVMPSIIPWVCRAARLDETEALKTFNMGLGMILAVRPDKAEEVCTLLQAEGEEAFVVGRVVPGSGQVTYVDQELLFVVNDEE